MALLEHGFAETFRPTAKLHFGGRVLTQLEILAVLRGIEKLHADVDDARSLTRQALRARDAALPAALAFVGTAVAMLRSQHGPQNPVLVSYGIAIPAPRRPRRRRASAAPPVAQLPETKVR